MGDSRRYQELLALAGKNTAGRRDVEKALAEARKRFSKAKDIAQKCVSEMEAVQTRLETAEEELEAAKNAMLRLSKQVQVMDLTGAEGVRSKGDDDTFMIGGKEHHVDTDDLNDVRIIPIKEYEKQQQDANDGGVKIATASAPSVFDQIVRSHRVSGRRFG